MDNIQYPGPKQEYKVLVRCFTFNHSKYIEDALNGFAMQQTNFPFVCLVMDDASTDGEQVVIKQWMAQECDMDRAETIDIPTSIVIIVPHKTNPSCTFAFYLLKQNLYKAKELKIAHVTPWRAKCEYEAMCEGDDYWIDEYKLKNQVDFLDNNPDYGMCYSQCNYFYQNKEHLVTKSWGGPNETFEQFMKCNTVPTLTVMTRVNKDKEYYDRVDPYSKGWLMGDYPRWIWYSHESKIKFLSYSTGVYRVLSSSASHSSDVEKQILFATSSIDIRRYFEYLFHIFPETYVQPDSLERRKLYLYAINHQFRNFIIIILKNPQYMFSLKVIGYFRYFLMKKKTSDEV